MNSELLVSLVCLFIEILLFSIFLKNRKVAGDTEINQSLEDTLFEEIRDGKNATKIAYLYNPGDISFIESVLIFENIPYYFEFRHLSKVKFGLPQKEINNVVLYCLEEDSQTVRDILTDLKKTKSYQSNRSHFVRNIVEIIMFQFAVPSNNIDNIMIL